MASASPSVFRASAAQRSIAVILTLGCLLVAGYGMSLAAQNFPKAWRLLKLAQSQPGEPTALIWLSIVAACVAALLAGVVLMLAALALVLIEGTQILVDELGITVDCPLLPKPIARRLGAGRILWKNVSRIERRTMHFVLHGDSGPNKPVDRAKIRFLFVDQLELLIFIIIERSPNLNL
jgi:hypothetical protein